MPANQTTEYLLLGALALIWSTSFLLIKVALDDFGPYTVTAARLVIGAAILTLALLHSRSALPMDGQAIRLYLFIGIFGLALPFGLISVGEVYIDSAMAAILMGIMPISTFVLAHLLIPAEPMTGRKLFGVSLGLFGLLTLVGLSALSGIGSHPGGQLLVLGGALSYSVSAVYVRRQRGFGGIQMALGTTIVAALLASTVALIVESPFSTRPDTTSLTAIIVLGVFPTAVASLLYFRVIASLGAVVFSQINYAVPVLGGLWGMLFLGEELGPRVFVALGLVLIGVYFVQPRRTK